MADLTLPEVITRFRGNEARIADFTNGNAAGYYVTVDGKKIETLPNLVTRLAAAIAAASATRTDLAAATGSTLIGYGAVTLKTYLDNQATAQADIKKTADSALPKSGGTLTGTLVLAGAPTSALHAATKDYVDGMAPVVGFLELTSTAQFAKPAGARFVYVEAVGAGAGGQWSAVNTGSSTGISGGGWGGDFNAKLFRAADLPASLTVTIGSGGTAGNSTAPSGGPGGDTKFGDLLTAKGGTTVGGSFYNTDRVFKTTTIGAPGAGYYYNSSSYFLGTSAPGTSQKAGAGGAAGTSSNSTVGSTAAGGISEDGGSGGDGNAATQAAADGKLPGGGGGGCSGGPYAGKGGNGRVRIWWW